MGPGGAERVVSLLAAEFARRGDEVSLITVASPDDDFFSVDPAVSRRSLDLGARPRGLQRVSMNLHRRKALRDAVEAVRPQVVVSFLEATNILALVSSNAPVVVSVRTNPEVHPRRRLLRALRRLLYARAAGVVLQTKPAADWARRFLPPDRVFAIPNPVLPAAGPPSQRLPRIVAIGRMDQDKGFDLLLEAFARVANHSEWRLVIAGTGPDRDALEVQARALDIRDRVEFPGLVADTQTLLSQSSIFVLPSRTEGFPNVLLEAMAAGLPVVAADCRHGPREVIRHAEDGLLVAPEDPETLAEAIRRLIEDPSERERLGSAATSVVERFGVARIADRWEQVFEAVAGSSAD